MGVPPDPRSKPLPDPFGLPYVGPQGRGGGGKGSNGPSPAQTIFPRPQSPPPHQIRKNGLTGKMRLIKGAGKWSPIFGTQRVYVASATSPPPNSVDRPLSNPEHRTPHLHTPSQCHTPTHTCAQQDHSATHLHPRAGTENQQIAHTPTPVPPVGVVAPHAHRGNHQWPNTGAPSQDAPIQTDHTPPVFRGIFFMVPNKPQRPLGRFCSVLEAFGWSQ